MLKKGVIYCRVSSKEQEKEGFSIPAQRKLLEEYALKNQIQVVKTFADAETAKSTGREQFGLMVDYLKQCKSTQALLVEKTDRLYRNFKDYVILDDVSDIEIHLVKESEILSKDSKSHQKFIHGIKVLMAKNYIDNLSEEVKKGLYEKAANGEYPGQAPTGYLNDKEKHIMLIDPERAPLIKKIYELYATGEYSLVMIHQWAIDNYLTSKHGKPLSKANLDKILKNPVYYGDFVYSGKQYHGVHEPIVTKELWDRVQKAFNKRNKGEYKRKGDFAYAGLLTCADCGCSVVSEIKKERYVYYHCSKAKKECSLKKSYVREEKLTDQFEDIFKSIQISQPVIDKVVKSLKESYNDKNRFRDSEIISLRSKIDMLRSRIDQSYTDKLDGKISENFWRKNTNRWQDELATYENKLIAYSKADIPYYENGKLLLELAKNAHRLYLRATNDEKRKLLKLVLSNCTLNGSTIEYQIRNPFHNFVKWASCPPVLGD
ncbi:MAG: recombinase family protein [Pseudomonadota bacterium]